MKTALQGYKELYLFVNITTWSDGVWNAHDATFDLKYDIKDRLRMQGFVV